MFCKIAADTLSANAETSAGNSRVSGNSNDLLLCMSVKKRVSIVSAEFCGNKLIFASMKFTYR